MNESITKRLERAKEQISNQPIGGARLDDLNRFDPDTKYMIVEKIMSNDNDIGSKGDLIRVFLSQEGYNKAIHTEQAGKILITQCQKVENGQLISKKGEPCL